MNFKTTIVLIVLLAIAAGWLLFTRERPTESTAPAAASLVDVTPADVNKVVVTPSDGTAFTLEKSGATWELTSPVHAPAETFEVDSLVRAFTDAKPTGSVDTSTGSGLNPPREVVELDTPSRSVKLDVGDHTAVGDSVYVQVDGQSKVQLVPAADLNDRLTKGAGAYRKTALVSAAADQIRQITIQPANQPTIVLQKHGTAWEMTAPQREPVDDSAVSDLTFALAGLRADSFADPASVPPADTARPQLTVSFSTQPAVAAPATAPSTQAVVTTIHFDDYQDILKKNLYVTTSDSNAVALVPASTLDSFRKTPLDLRDKKIADFDPNVVKRISLETQTPATTSPTARPASVSTLVLEKRKAEAKTLGPVLPTSSTKPASASATQPAPQSKWQLANDPAGTVDDVKVATLLAALHPLRADKYLASPPAGPADARYTLTITTSGPFGSNQVEHTLHFTAPPGDTPLVGSYDGLIFETSRSLLTDLQGAWIKKP